MDDERPGSGRVAIAVVNAAIHTFDDTFPTASAMLVRDGRVAQLGETADILEQDVTEVLDLSGAPVLPGFVDGHCHFELTCLTMDRWINVHTPPYTSLASVSQVLEGAVKSDQGSGWLLCRSSFAMHEKVEERRLFSRGELDRISPQRPLAVFASLHVASVNTAGLKALGLWEDGAPHPFHGVVHRDASGTPTGVVTEVFMMLPTPATPQVFSASVVEHGRGLFSSAGTTTVATMPESLEQVAQLRHLHRQGQLPMRQSYYLISPGVATLDQARELAASEEDSDTWRLGGIKVFVNGCGHDGLGVEHDDPKWTQDELDAFVSDAHRSGFQVWMHSLNSRGVAMAAKAIHRCDPTGANTRRHRIEHGGDFIDLDDLPAVRASGALLVTTPQFLHSMTNDPSGPRAPLRTLQASGIRLLGGTDSTGTVPSSTSVLGNVTTAVLRRRADGSAFHPEEGLDVGGALALFTTASAHGIHDERNVGSLGVGRQADFTVLSADPLHVEPERLGEVRPLQTYLGGTRVWSESGR